MYRSDERIVTVGDGNLSFTLALARAFGSGANLTATTLDDESFLHGHYPGVACTIDSLRASGARVFHGVDATKPELYDAVLDGAPPPQKIVFNFPHPGWPENWSTTVPRTCENSRIMIERHRALLRGFFENCKVMIERTQHPAMEVHVTHNTSLLRVDRWETVALGKECGFEHVGTHSFDAQPFQAHGYQNKYGVLKEGSPAWRINRRFALNAAETDVFRRTTLGAWQRSGGRGCARRSAPSYLARPWRDHC